jgi:predicted nucleic acid-binding Zn ribbon protein
VSSVAAEDAPVSDHCPSCGAGMATDQRYCLECGKRRGDPRLPFMDAVVLMNAMQAPATVPAAPAPAKKRQRVSANASLIAGVGILLLALGVGVMIGQSNDNGAVNAASAAPQIIKVGGGGEETATASTAGAGAAGAKSGKAKKAKAPEKAVDSSGTSEAAAEILKPAGDVKLPPPTVQKGGKCEAGAAGCEGGEFTGDFFGE